MITTSNDPAEAWRIIRLNARQIALNIPVLISEISKGNITIERIFAIYMLIKNSRDQLTALADAPHLSTYVSGIMQDAEYDILAEISETTEAMSAAMNWVNTNANGLQLNGDTAENYIIKQSIVTNRFNAVQLSGFTTLLQNINNTISV